MCTKIMMTSLGCWWTSPWEHERHKDEQIYKHMGEEEECDSNYVLGSVVPYVVDEHGQSAEDIDVVPIVFDEHLMTNVSTIKCELRYTLDSLVNKYKRNPLQFSLSLSLL